MSSPRRVKPGSFSIRPGIYSILTDRTLAEGLADPVERARKLVKGYFVQTTRGCNNIWCTNEYCVSKPAMSVYPVTFNQIVAT